MKTRVHEPTIVDEQPYYIVTRKGITSHYGFVPEQRKDKHVTYTLQGALELHADLLTHHMHTVAYELHVTENTLSELRAELKRLTRD